MQSVRIIMSRSHLRLAKRYNWWYCWARHTYKCAELAGVVLVVGLRNASSEQGV